MHVFHCLVVLVILALLATPDYAIAYNQYILGPPLARTFPESGYSMWGQVIERHMIRGPWA